MHWYCCPRTSTTPCYGFDSRGKGYIAHPTNDGTPFMQARPLRRSQVNGVFYLVSLDGGEPVPFPDMIRNLSLTIQYFIQDQGEEASEEVGKETLPFPVKATRNALALLSEVIQRLNRERLLQPINQMRINQEIDRMDLSVESLMELLSVVNYLDISVLIDAFSYRIAGSLSGDCSQQTKALLESGLPHELIEEVIKYKMPEVERYLSSCLEIKSTYVEDTLPFQITSVATHRGKVATGMYMGLIFVGNGLRDEQPRVFLQNSVIPVKSLSFHPSGDRLAVALEGGTIIILNLQNEEEVDRIEGIGSTTNYFSIAYSPNGEHLAITSNERNYVKIYDIATRTILHTLEVSATCVAYNTRNPQLALGSIDGRVNLYNTTNWRSKGGLKTPAGKDVVPVCLTFSPDGYNLVIGRIGYSRPLFVFNLLNKKRTTIALPEGQGAQSLAFHVDYPTTSLIVATSAAVWGRNKLLSYPVATVPLDFSMLNANLRNYLWVRYCRNVNPDGWDLIKEYPFVEYLRSIEVDILTSLGFQVGREMNRCFPTVLVAARNRTASYARQHGIQ